MDGREEAVPLPEEPKNILIKLVVSTKLSIMEVIHVLRNNGGRERGRERVRERAREGVRERGRGRGRETGRVRGRG